jgi:catechol 2,3-dioxygenase-like lactoylglutathione lyase family enzyme
MNQQSAVDFPSQSRVHIALGVTDVRKAEAFYEALLGQKPAKVRPNYAKFETVEPAVNLALNESGRTTAVGSPQHFGIQVKDTDAVKAMRTRMAEAGYAVESEEGVACCYAVQDKVWVSDPDGHRWEVFVVLEADVPVYAPQRSETSEPCCEPGCCQ